MSSSGVAYPQQQQAETDDDESKYSLLAEVRKDGPNTPLKNNDNDYNDYDDYNDHYKHNAPEDLMFDESRDASAAIAAADGTGGAGDILSVRTPATPSNAAIAGVGTMLEAAFVDPAYQWPPADGEGRNAIELQASLSLMYGEDYAEDDDLEDELDAEEEEEEGPDFVGPRSVRTMERDEERLETLQREHSQLQQQTLQAPYSEQQPTMIKTTTKKKKKGWFGCCRSAEEDVIVMEPPPPTPEIPVDVAEEVTYEMEVDHMQKQRLRAKKNKMRAERRKNRYGRVPEGILIYRLNTMTRTITLLSHPHSRTNLDTLVREMVVVQATPSHDKSRRGMNLVGKDGSRATLVACEQRTAIAWLETLSIILEINSTGIASEMQKVSDVVASENNETNNEMQGQYLNLANYSNKLIRSGVLPGSKKGGGGAGGIYYSIELQHDEGDDVNQEALESIAKRRAVIKDSWDFYRMICSLLRDKHKYDEVFRRMQLDPVYPYLNSMSGLNDPADGGISGKVIYQKNLPEYQSLSSQQIAEDLVARAEKALPSLVEICKALAGSLGMEEVGVGPTKDVQAALLKADRKYQGDLLKVTDYCRALLVVKDFPSLLALLELARDSFGPLIRRVKMSSLKSDYRPKPGGYRDCIINVELKEHICEIQVQLWPMWGVCGVDGFRHYRHCLEYNTDSFENPYESLEGLSRKTRAELIVMAEEAVVDTPLDNLEWYHEKNILDYFAEVGLFLKHGLDVWAEITLRQLIRLRIESPDIGPDHHETIILYKYLAQALQAQGKTQEAHEAYSKVKNAERKNIDEKQEADQSLWESFLSAQTEALEMIIDPNRKEREEEENLKREVKASKKQWRRIRNERFNFLDLNIDSIQNFEEKKQ